MKRLDLSHAELAGRDLRGMDYRGASFVGANLARATLSDLDLTGADFRRANLAAADLAGACLIDVDFRGADLSATNLTAADRRGARFEGASMVGARLAQSLDDLEGAEITPVLRTELPFITGTGLAFSRDGRYLAVAGPGFSAMLWDLIARAPVRRFEGHESNVLGLAMSPDGTWLATASADETVRLHHVTNQKVVVLHGHTDAVFAVTFTPDGKYLASGGQDGFVRLWSLDNMTYAAALNAKKPIVALALPPRPKRVFAALDGGRVLSWTRAGGLPTALRAVRGATSAAFSPRATYVVHGTEAPGRAIVRRVATGEVVFTTPKHMELVNVVGFDPSGRHIVTGSRDGRPTLWSLRAPHKPRVLVGHASFVAAAAFGPDGLVATAEGTGGIHLLRHGRPDGALAGYGSEVLAVSLSRDGRMLATGSADGRLHAFELEPEVKLIGSWVPHGERRLDAIAIDPEGRFIVSGGDDATVRVIDLERREVIEFAVKVPSDIATLILGGDRMTVYAGDESGQVHAIDRGTGTIRWSVPAHKDGVLDLAATKDGAMVATCGWDRNVRLLNAATGTIRATIRVPGRLARAIAFGRDDTELHVALDDGRIAVYDSHTGRRVQTEEVHQSPVQAVAMTDDGRMRISSDRGGQVAVVTLGDGHTPTHFPRHPGETKAAAVSGDGNTIATGCEDGIVRIWSGGDATLRHHILPSGSDASAWPQVSSVNGLATLRRTPRPTYARVTRGAASYTLDDATRLNTVAANDATARAVIARPDEEA